MKEININELADETAFAYVNNLAKQRGEEHSYYSKDFEEDIFFSKYQDIFDKIYDLIEKELQNNKDLCQI